MMDLNRMFQEKNYEILKNKLDLDINNNADSLNHTMSNFIDLKAISLNKYITEMYENLNINYSEDKITDEYLIDYHSHIDNLTASFAEDIEIEIRKEVCTNFSENIVKSYKLPDESSREMLLEYINKSYCNSLIEKIKSEANLRNATLKNLSKEAFERFKSMNEKTVE